MMNVTDIEKWREANQRYLIAAIRVLQGDMEKYRKSLGNEGNSEERSELTEARIELEKAAGDMPAPAAIDQLTRIFGLTDFERNIILLCAGIELDSQFASFISSLQGESGRIILSAGFVLAALPNAHWSAITPVASIRYWNLIDIGNSDLLTTSPITINERILHYLTGLNYLEDKLTSHFEPEFTINGLVPSHQELADKIFEQYKSYARAPRVPVFLIYSRNGADIPELVSAVCSKLNKNVYSISTDNIPGNLNDIKELAKSWNRESALSDCALYVDCTGTDNSDQPRVINTNTFCNNIAGLVFIGTNQWSPRLRRQVFRCDLSKPSAKEQLSLWKGYFKEEPNDFDGLFENLVSQFNLNAKTIRIISSEILSQKINESPDIKDRIRKSCCIQTRPKISGLAQRIEPLARWDDLILPELQKNTLRDIAAHVRNRSKVYNDWGFSKSSSRGLGISALFTGESGTGKTMASEVLANELKLDLYRIDLSQVVNKYIGETEKNLKKIFDSAEDGGAILLFDEADALFGKRSEVKDSHDRYANIEVSYLLQRMDDYRGLAILTTNMKSALDKAFLRRIRFIVQFPFPDAEHRAEIWQRIFPSDTPVNGMDMAKLSRLNVSGGIIRNIALKAAFIAAEKNEPVNMAHIFRAAQNEYTKMEKPMSSIEKGTW